MISDEIIRPGEIGIELPDSTDAALFFIGRIRTPWSVRALCPRQSDPQGPLCRIEIDARWIQALEGLSVYPRIQVLYWMHEARRDLVVQVPRISGAPAGTFALRSPVRPNPIASSVVELVSVEGTTVTVRGLDCLDGTPLIDLKPARD